MFAPNHPGLVFVIISERWKGGVRNSLARRALVASFDSLSIAAVEGLRQLQGEQLLADARFAGEEKRAWQTTTRQESSHRLLLLRRCR
jgi:hypothetical protein